MFIKLVHRDTLSVEATVERAPNGDLLLLCTCGGTGEPQIENRVLSFRSKDDGKTWTKGTQIHEEDGRAHYQTETARIGDEIRVFISTHDGKFLDWKNYFLSSYDSGETWQKHPLPELDRFAFVRGKVDLSNGEMIFPYHAYPIDEKLNEESKRENRPAYLNSAVAGFAGCGNFDLGGGDLLYDRYPTDYDPDIDSWEQIDPDDEDVEITWFTNYTYTDRISDLIYKRTGVKVKFQSAMTVMPVVVISFDIQVSVPLVYFESIEMPDKGKEVVPAGNEVSARPPPTNTLPEQPDEGSSSLNVT